jgi:hypothetical protein
MHSYAAAAISSLLLLPLASAGCYKDDVPGASIQFALDHVYDAASYLQGSLANGQERGLCITDVGAGNQWYLSVINRGKSWSDVSREVIEKYLRMEINGCLTKGGKREHENKISYKYVITADLA